MTDNYILLNQYFGKYYWPANYWPDVPGSLIAIRDLTVQARSISFSVQERHITLHPYGRNISFEVEDL
jgi:hypothetical protein